MATKLKVVTQTVPVLQLVNARKTKALELELALEPLVVVVVDVVVLVQELEVEGMGLQPPPLCFQMRCLQSSL